MDSLPQEPVAMILRHWPDHSGGTAKLGTFNATSSLISSDFRHICIKPYSYSEPWKVFRQLLSQNYALSPLYSFAVKCDLSMLGGEGSLCDIARHVLGHPDLTTILDMLRAAPNLERFELDLGQQDVDQMIPWECFGQTTRIIERLIGNWQLQPVSGDPSLGKAKTLVIRFIDGFPLSVLTLLGCLHLETSTLSITEATAGRTICAADCVDFSCLKELRMTVVDEGELMDALLLLKRISPFVKRVTLSFRHYSGEFPNLEDKPRNIYFPHLEFLRIECKGSRMPRHTYTILRLIHQYIVPLSDIRLVAYGKQFPNLDLDGGLGWNLFQALLEDAAVFPYLKHISVELATRIHPLDVPQRSDRTTAVQTRLKNERAVDLDFLIYQYN
ncbi:hypothetical protein P691DRAFT_763963 [Macrolepiota fuliginosa MF-IS2]|uniref:Uncharacterized protein n=1 Tax=Macrolepiota fuliginosa MF-IS2 TaxID=1400762 RepID=A0A9P5X388_9AGAR|nr:hypothetical protein P691DRAFT_763963 [Macrolepiota fuliginosa MF-IS2]